MPPSEVPMTAARWIRPIHDGPDVVHPLLHVQAPDRAVGQARPPLVEDDHPAESAEMRKSAQGRIFQMSSTCVT